MKCQAAVLKETWKKGRDEKESEREWEEKDRAQDRVRVKSAGNKHLLPFYA